MPKRFLSYASRPRPFLLAIGVIVGFLIIITTQLQPSEPESRLPDRFRLAALIQRQQNENDQHRQAVVDLRKQLQGQRQATLNQGADVNNQKTLIQESGLAAGTVPVSGEGFVVTLDDSTLDVSPTGNVNDLVIHSQDVQAVVNGLWQAGAEAVSINGQRVVSTSAVLCVGNTLLINGTVHSPPYEVTAIGADRSRFSDDPLVTKLRRDAERFSLKFSLSGSKDIEVPAYSGSTVTKYAEVDPK